MIKIGICDDIKIECEQIYDILIKTNPQNKYKVYNSAETVMKEIEQIDLLVLDIEMPGITGMELAEYLFQKQQNVLIIFLTWHTEIMEQAFKVKAYRFLSKPICEAKLLEAVGKAQE